MTEQDGYLHLLHARQAKDAGMSPVPASTHCLKSLWTLAMGYHQSTIFTSMQVLTQTIVGLLLHLSSSNKPSCTPREAVHILVDILIGCFASIGLVLAL